MKGFSPAMLAFPAKFGFLFSAPMVMDPAITEAVQDLDSEKMTSGWLRLQIACSAIDAEHGYLCFALPVPGRVSLQIPFMPAGGGPSIILEGRNFRGTELRTLVEKTLGIRSALIMEIRLQHFASLFEAYGKLVSSAQSGRGSADDGRSESEPSPQFPDEDTQLAASSLAKEWVQLHRKDLERFGSSQRGTPFFGDQEFEIRDDFVFVLMPFSDQHKTVFDNVIKPLAKDMGLVCHRADDAASRAIMADVWRQINEARVIIADVTRSNPNVLYELGIAHTLGKAVILIYQEAKAQDPLPFDIRHIRTFRYENSIEGGAQLREDLRSALKTALGQ